MSRAAKIIIDLQALHHNFSQVKQCAPRAKTIAMVKANAYGHGLTTIATSLTQADALGVACTKEAMLLQEAGIKKPIVLMQGFFNTEELKLVQQFQWEVVIHDYYQVMMLENMLKKPINVWLKIDSGMHRLGFMPDNFHSVYERLNALAYVNKPIRLMTHFSDADNTENQKTITQADQFNQLTQTITAEKTLANSAAIIAWPQTHADWVRPGLMLYGVSPMINTTAIDHQLKPVMTLQSEIIAIHDFQAGDCIGYGSTWQCPEAMRVAVVTIGYGDGYPFSAEEGTPVLIGKEEASLVGRVSMDMITVDLRTCPEVKVHDRVTLWGKGLPVEIIAKRAGTIPYELLCSITQRVSRFKKSL